MLVYNYIILDLSPIFSFYTILQPPWVVCIIVWLAFWYMISTPCFPSKLTASYLWHCEKHCLRCLHNPYLRSPNLEDILGVNPSLGFTMMLRVPPDDSQRKVQRQESCFFFIVGAHNFTVDMMLAHVSHCQMSFDLEVIDGVMIHDWLDLMCLLT